MRWCWITRRSQLRQVTLCLITPSVRFIAAPGARYHAREDTVTSIEMAPDTSGNPTVLASGSLQFFVIERIGHVA